MSDLKKVLKAGFLITASFFATGCSSDNADGSTTTPKKPDGGGTGGNGGTTATKSAVLTATPNLAMAVDSLMKVGYSAVDLGSVADYGKDYDVFKKLQTHGAESAPLALSAGVTVQPKPASLLNLTNLKMKPADTLLFDASVFGASDKDHIGALFLAGAIDGSTRYVATSNLKGNLKVPALAVRNAVIRGAGGTSASSISAFYAYVGVDAALGYESARVDAKGAAEAIPVSVHAEPTAPAAALALSAGAAKASTSTQTKGVTTAAAKTSAVKEAAKTTAKTAPTAATTGALVLKSLPGSAELEGKLDAAGLHVFGPKLGAFDIAGRVSEMETENTVVSSVNGHVVELDIPAAVTTAAGASGVTTAAKTTTKTSKLALSAATTAKPAATTAKTAVTKPPAQPTAHATSQTLVKPTAGAHKFLFEIKHGYHAEVGKWTVKAGSEMHAIPHQSLIVHELDLSAADLGIRINANAHAMEKLTGAIADFDATGGTDADKTTKGQAMMEKLVKEGHAIHVSDVVEESGDAKQYHHFDSHTSFPLWVVGDVKGAGKKLELKGIDVNGGTFEAGTYAMPLVKDFTMKLPNSSGSTAFDLGNAKGLQAKSWKIISNGYNDMVLLVEVGAKSSGSLALGSGVVHSILMGSDAQSGRSALSATVDRVVERLNPTNVAAVSFANLSTARINQAAQIASLTRGVNGAVAETLGAVEHYAVSFNHNGTNVGFTYSLNGGNAFAEAKGSSSLGVNVASDVAGFKAIVSADASVDAAKNAYVSASNAAYNAGVTFAKAYSLGGLSVVPMAGFGVASNAINGYSAVVPMAVSSLGLSMNDASFAAATFHAGVNVALDEFVATESGLNASLAFGVAGYLASTANATLSTSEGKSANLQFGGNAVTPYAQFNLGFNTGEKVNAMISSGLTAVNFGIDR